MKMRKGLLAVLVTGAVVLLLGLSACDKSDTPDSGSGTAQAETIELCTHCGQVKGGELCCKPDQEKCSACSLVKGSPGCCKIPKGTDKAEICSGCGQIKGTDKCCKPDQPKCGKCNMVKGSPGCCLKKS